MIELASANSNVSRLRRLQRRRSAREADGCIVVEGVKAVLDALQAQRVESIFVRADDGLAALSLLGEVDASIAVYALDAKTFADIASTVTPQGAMAIVSWRAAVIDDIAFDRGPAIVLDGVADPGNVGTIVRIADAAGACAVFAGPGTVDVTAAKVVRSAAGSLLRVPVVTSFAAAPAVAELRARSVRCIGAVARGGVAYDACDWSSPVAVVLGSEAHGIDDAVGAVLDGEVRIDMAPGAESLNVAVACAVLAFEIRRQSAKRSGR
ncbi:MAG: RNA methyltransferase [Acidimicrobiales bacterium]